MRIAFNATSLLSPFTGIGQYTYQLAKGLQARSDLNLDFFYATGWSKNLRDRPVAGIVPIKSVVKKIIPNIYAVNRLIQQHRFQRGAAKQVDVYHEPNFLAFKFSGPTVLTVHDLSWVRFPEAHPSERVRAMNRYFESSLQRATRVVTDSEFVKQELMDVFGLSSDLIRPIPLGVDALFHPRTKVETQAVLAHHQLTHGHYLLSVGTLEPRKNLQTVLQAYSQLPSSIQQHFPLVIVGMKGWHHSALAQQLAPLLRTGVVRQIGYLPREQLACMISGAATLVYPSLYEGFGLPPLEAMASAVPVITSNGSSLPEVLGDTGLLIEPLDVTALVNSMERLLIDLQLRDQLAEKALARSAEFTWERCVERTVDVYLECSSL